MIELPILLIAKMNCKKHHTTPRLLRILALLAPGPLALLPACTIPDPPIEDFVKTAVSRQLKDPDSAKFGPIAVRIEPKEDGLSSLIACGTVNGKNSFGAYAGDVRFVAQGSVVLDQRTIYSVHIEEGTPSGSRAFEQVVWLKYCETPPPGK